MTRRCLGKRGKLHSMVRVPLKLARAAVRRIIWMYKVRDCHHICLFCEHYMRCRVDGAGKRRGKKR